MIPLRDNIPHKKLPIVTVGLMIINIVVFLNELILGENLQEFIFLYGFIPSRVFSSVGVGEKFLPLFTSMFLHAGWMHLIGNMLFMWIFADNVEDRLGHFKFLIFYIICGLFAAFVHGIFNLHSAIPAIGASGAIAGVLGAYFVIFPRAKVLTLIPIFFFWQIVELPASFFLGFWFLYQLFLGVISTGTYATGIAFWAHIGGFLGGMLFLKLFIRRLRFIRN
ncbi:MAG: rhomboid family intramembrane serine protease [Candidatus Omnitrophota bacterium]|nr:MAG: rhomboid family intramembrane serine protease [Candidatus Omnitrophota bacterium]